MTDERTTTPSGATADEVAADKDRRSDERPEGPSGTPRSPDERTAQEDDDDTNPLLREGPDAPDAADIEDPDEQL